MVELNPQAPVQVASEGGLFEVRLYGMRHGVVSEDTRVATWRTSNPQLRADFREESSWIQLGELRDFLALEGHESYHRQILESLTRQVVEVEQRIEQENAS